MVPDPRQATRLNLGSGEMPKPRPWVNVDAVKRGSVDVLADVRALPFIPGSIERIYAGHLVEHMYPTESVPALRHWWGLLSPGGQLGVLVPDVQRFWAIHREGGVTVEDMSGCIGGTRDPADPYALHVTVWNAPQLAWFVSSTLDVPVEPMDLNAWPVDSPSDWQVGVVAKR